MPTDAAFWDRIAPRYAARQIKDMDAYERTLARTRSRLSRGDRVLEAGCGTGTTALKLADAVASYTATDISAGMLEIARGKAEAEGAANLRFERAAVTREALPEGPFDVVLAFNLVHLLDDPADGLRVLASRVRPGGLLITKTVCLGDMGLWIRPLVWAMGLVGKAPRLRYLRLGDLERMISHAGLDMLERGTFPASPPGHFVVGRKPAVN